MKVKQQKIKVLNIALIVLFAASLLGACASPLKENAPWKHDDYNQRIEPNALQPKSAQTGPTGKLPIIVGVSLLILGFVIFLTASFLMIRHNIVHPAPV